MARAQGPGKTIAGGGLAVAAYARVYAQVQPLGGLNPGTVDSAGQYLHFRYEGNTNWGARSGGNQDPSAPDFVPNKMVVEFDALTEFVVPFEGQLYLVGGEGDWKFSMFVHEYMNPQFYQPELRMLRTFLGGAAPLVVPDFHTYILGVNPGVTFLLPTGDVLVPSSVLPGTNITPGLTLTPSAPTTVLTGLRL